MLNPLGIFRPRRQPAREINALPINQKPSPKLKKALESLHELGEYASIGVEELHKEMVAHRSLHLMRNQNVNKQIEDLKVKLAAALGAISELKTDRDELKATLDELTEFNAHDKRIQELGERLDCLEQYHPVECA